MWQILKTAFRYSRKTLIMAYALIFFVAALPAPLTGGYLAATAIALFIGVAAASSAGCREKRDRLYACLPVPIKRISASRMLFRVLLHFSLSTAWFLMVLMRSAEAAEKVFLVTVFISGLVLSTLFAFTIYHDLSFFNARKYRRMFWGVLFVVLLFVLPNLPFEGAADEKTPFQSESWFFNLFWLILFHLNYKVFIRRSSYLA